MDVFPVPCLLCGKPVVSLDDAVVYYSESDNWITPRYYWHVECDITMPQADDPDYEPTAAHVPSPSR